MEARLTLVNSWNILVDTLGTLARSGSERAALVWDKLPSAAPVGSRTTLMRAIAGANDMPLPLDCLPEWDAYLDALACFHALPLYGPAPMPIPEGCFAALDNGEVWLFSTRQRVAG